MMGKSEAIWNRHWRWELEDCSGEILVNLLQSNFTCEVRQNFPMLSRDDIHILLLIRVGMKNIEIAKLLHILPRSFRVRRCRLKKKMGIDCESLPEFIKGLFCSEKWFKAYTNFILAVLYTLWIRISDIKGGSLHYFLDIWFFQSIKKSLKGLNLLKAIVKWHSYILII